MLRLSSVIAALALTAAVPAAVQAAPPPACAGPGGVRLTVVATDLRNAHGEVAFTVYPDDRRRFLARGGKLARVRVPAAAPATTACFLLPPGSYAVAQYHDENADHDFNRTLFAPKEGFGFSNDAPTAIGLPSLAAARFTLGPAGGTVRMHMRYRR